MGQCLEKIKYTLPDGEVVTVQVFSDDETGLTNGYCFSKGIFIPNPYGDPRKAADIPAPPQKSTSQIQAEIAEIGGYQTLPLDNKKLSAASLATYGVVVGVSEVDGTSPETIYYPYTKAGKTVGYKVKLIPRDGQSKRMWSVGDMKNVDLFGWNRAIGLGSKKLIITEGEDDAIALTAIINRFQKPEYKDWVAVVSIPHGAGNAKRDLAKYKNEILSHFKEVVLCFDMDEAGRAAVEECVLLFPEAVSVTLPRKDANQCLIDGVPKAAFNAVMFNAEKPKNTRLVFGSDLHEAARIPPTYGELTWPWEHLNKTTRGIRLGETIYIGAGVKMGKSELLNAIAAHFIKRHNVKVFMAKPEESNKKTYKLLAGKIVGKVFHDPEKDFDYVSYDKAGEVLRDKLAMVNLYQHLGWETLKADIIAAVNWGAKAVFIDPITNLTNGIDSGEANTKLQEIAQDLASMALDYNIVIFIFCHLKAPEGNIAKDKREKLYRDGKYIGLGNCPHELGGDVVSAQFAGSRAMMRSCNMMLGLEGNKDNDLTPEIKNMRDLVLLEDREFGETGRFPLYWNSETTVFVENG
jgi:twinkle protein